MITNPLCRSQVSQREVHKLQISRQTRRTGTSQLPTGGRSRAWRGIVLAVVLVLVAAPSLIPKASSAMGPSQPTTTVLRQFVAPVSGNGRGLAFNGANLFYTLYTPTSTSSCGTDTNIYVLNTQGVRVNTLSTSHAFGALAWNGSLLWGAADYGCSPSTQTVFTIDPNTAATSLKISKFSFPAGDLCAGGGTQLPNNADGLAVAGGTIWLSDDEGRTAYKLDVGGNVLSTMNFGIDCNNGIAFDGANNWFAMYAPPNPDVTFRSGIMMHRTDAGVVLSGGFQTDGLPYEGLAFDATTFAPNCALWGISDGHLELGLPIPIITAFQVPCTGGPAPSHELTTFGVWAMYSNGNLVGVISPCGTVTINSVIANMGNSTETSTVTVSVNSAAISGPQSYILSPGQTINPQVSYTVPCQLGLSFIPSASVAPVPGEANTADNTATGRTFFTPAFGGGGGCGIHGFGACRD